MARRKRWEELGVVNGVGEIRFLKWSYFIDYVHQEMLDFDHYIWRGQKNFDWPLQTTLDRLIERPKTDKTERHNFIKNHLEKFQYAVTGRRGSNPTAIETENEWWALGQHHGLATPLLDWTTSPFVAAYFAFIPTDKPQSKYRSVFAITKPGIKRKSEQIKSATEIENKVKLKEAEENNNRLMAAYYRRVL